VTAAAEAPGAIVITATGVAVARVRSHRARSADGPVMFQ
jgi:hypothetical protein